MFSLFRVRSHACAVFAALSLSSLLAFGQGGYPSKAIHLVVGFPAGGSVDAAARIIAEGLGPRLNVAIVIDNVGGAAGSIGAQRVVSSPPDGYTLLLGSSNEMAATGLVNPAQKYDPLRDLTPLGVVATAPVMLVAGPRAGVKTLGNFIATVKRSPGKFSYGTSGVGSILHFAGELVKERAGIFMTHIPYRGTTALTTDLAGGNIEYAFMSTTAAAPFIQSGRIVPLAISSAKRSPAFPSVPSLSEHPSLKGYEMTGWFALAGPRNLPVDIAQRLTSTLQAVLQDPAIQKRLDGVGMRAASGQEDLGQLMRTDMAQYRKLVEFAHIKE